MLRKADRNQHRHRILLCTGVPLKIVSVTLALLISCFSMRVSAQTCNGVLRVINNDDFGTGSNLFGPALGSSVTTNYKYMDGNTILSCGSNTYHQRVEDGSYCLVKTPDSALVTCKSSGNGSNTKYTISSDWTHATDHTGNNGYMLLCNAAGVQDVFYEKLYDNLCSGMTCQFSIWATNICYLQNIQPQVTIELRNPVTNAVLKSVTSSLLPYPTATALNWQQLSLTFSVPAGLSSVRMVVRNEQTGNGGNDLALDDVSFSVCVPPATLASAAKTRTASECASQTFDITASVSSGTFTNINYQWQQQLADGTWSNIVNPNGVTNNTFTTPSLPASSGAMT